MKENFEKLKEIYQNIYTITLQISSLINDNNLEEIQCALNKREIFIQNKEKIIITEAFSDDEIAELNNLIIQIKAIEDKNIAQMESRQNLVKQRLIKLNKNYKILSSYKYIFNINPVIVDKKE